MAHKPIIQVLERTLDIIDLLARYERPMRSTEISEKLSLHKSTANNIIRTLFRRGYLAQMEDGKYYIGLHCYNIGSLCDLCESLRQAAAPVIESLSDSTGDNTILVTESGGKIITVASANGHGAIVISRKHPYEERFHCTASGKALLAFDKTGLLDRIKKTADLKRYTERTITEWETLLDELENTKKIGYSISDNEGIEGVCSIGVPIFNNKNDLLGILAQPFPDYFVKTGRIKYLERSRLLLECAEKIKQNYTSI